MSLKKAKGEARRNNNPIVHLLNNQQTLESRKNAALMPESTQNIVQPRVFQRISYDYRPLKDLYQQAQSPKSMSIPMLSSPKSISIPKSRPGPPKSLKSIPDVSGEAAPDDLVGRNDSKVNIYLPLPYTNLAGGALNGCASVLNTPIRVKDVMRIRDKEQAVYYQ